MLTNGQIVEWVDIFSRKEQRDIIIQLIEFCINQRIECITAYCYL